MVTEHRSLFIDGGWVEPRSSKRITVVNAATEEILGTVPHGSEADIDAAVAAARRAFSHGPWHKSTPAERGAALNRFADAIQKRAGPLSRSVSMQNGMPIAIAEQIECGYGVGMMRYYATLATNLQTDERRPSPLGSTTLVCREPIGVVGAIVPWNFPVALSIAKIGPALAAGCVIVLKPSPETVLDCFILAEAAEEAKLPGGVINWVPGGRALGAYLVSHPGIDKVSFTGSTAAGRSIAQVCGQLLRPVGLELGGKSAAIVLEDAKLETVLNGLPMASLLNNGQACFACTRLLVPDSRYPEFVDAVAGLAESLVIGDPLDAATQMGPMVSEAHRDRVEKYIATGKRDAKLVAGGGRPSGQSRGWFVQPTVFSQVSNASVIAREEIFGPVLSIIRYTDENDAIEIANDSDYGLGGTVWSSDQAGQVMQMLGRPQVPHNMLGLDS
jgi:acyl-CoA reductase-like NAD-dependent aldehyde dehydrogenase